MSNAVVASLRGAALRGAVAGARLRRRFSVDPLWRRHQWLRLRIAMGNLDELRDAMITSARDSLYRGFAADGAACLDALIASQTQHDPDPPSILPDEPDPWFRPVGTAYWTAQATTLAEFGAADGWAPVPWTIENPGRESPTRLPLATGDQCGR